MKKKNCQFYWKKKLQKKTPLARGNFTRFCSNLNHSQRPSQKKNRKYPPLGGNTPFGEKKISLKGEKKSRERHFPPPRREFSKNIPRVRGYPRFLGNRAPLAERQKTRASFISPAILRFFEKYPPLGGILREYPFFLRNRAPAVFVRVPHARKFATRFPVLRLRRPKCSQQQNRYPVELAQPCATSRYPPPAFDLCFQRNSPTLGVVAVLAVRVKRCCGA